MNPEGRPKGTYNGRIRALATLDSFMSDPQVQNDLHAAFREAFQKNPMRFFRQIVMPLLPAQTKLTLDAEGVIAWRSFLTTPPHPGQLAIHHARDRRFRTVCCGRRF